MIRSLNTGVGGIRNFQTSLDVIANNLANLNTVGFKGGRVDFAEALTQTVRPSTPDEGNTSGSSSVAISNGVATNSVTTIFGQGAINQTGKITDLALAGDGYFIVKKYGTPSIGGDGGTEAGGAGSQGIAQPNSNDKGAPGGISYATRAGDFRLDKNGNLVNNAGMRVQGISDYINNPGEVGDIKFDRGEFMASVDILRGSTDNKTIVTAKAHGFKTGNIVIFKSEGEMPGTELQEATPYYVRVVDDNKLLLYGDLHSASTDTTQEHELAKSVPADKITITGMRIIKKLASYEGVHTVGINEENTITSAGAHGLKDGDNVRFYSPNSINVLPGTMSEVTPGTGTWSVEIDASDYLTSMSKGKVLNFGAGKEFVIESVVPKTPPAPGDDPTSYLITGSVAGRTNPQDLTAETKFTMQPLMSLVTTVDIANMSDTGTVDEWSFDLTETDFSSLAPIKAGTVLNLGLDKQLRVTEVEAPANGKVKITGSAIGVGVEFTGVNRLSHEGYKQLSNTDDQDASGGFSQTFFVSVKGEKSFTIHNSTDDAFSRSRAVKFENGSLFNSSLVKVAATTTAQIQNVNVDTAGRVNVMLTDGTQYTRGQILLRKFTNQQALDKEGGNMYTNLANAGVSEWSTPGSDGFARIEAGALELSNVDVAREFSKLISTQRAFQANARMVSASDQILQELLRLKR